MCTAVLKCDCYSDHTLVLVTLIFFKMSDSFYTSQVYTVMFTKKNQSLKNAHYKISSIRKRVWCIHLHDGRVAGESSH